MPYAWKSWMLNALDAIEKHLEHKHWVAFNLIVKKMYIEWCLIINPNRYNLVYLHKKILQAPF